METWEEKAMKCLPKPQLPIDQSRRHTGTENYEPHTWTTQSLSEEIRKEFIEILRENINKYLIEIINKMMQEPLKQTNKT